MGALVFCILFAVIGVILLLVSLRRKGKVLRIVSIVVLVLAGGLLIASMITVVDAGEIGVVVVFGRVRPATLGNGIHFVPPYARVVKYPVRLIEITQAGDNLVETRVNNGLTVKLDCTVLYTIDASMAAEVYSKVATSVDELGYKILLPLLRTAIRDVVSRYSAEELYSSKREFISSEIETTLRALVAPKGLLLDRFLIRGIFLPEEVDRAIQAKIASQQEAEAMTYKKQKAEQEAEIKIIEARGLAKAQEIINSTLTPTYLQHEAIQSYKELAGSPNTTFVIMSTSPTATGMPLILNAQR